MKVKKYLLATCCGVAAGSSGGAYAADLPLKAAGPAYVPAMTWTGPYIGAHIGAARMNSTNTQHNNDPGNAPYGYQACGGYYGINSCTLDATGAIGGIQAGYNWQNGSFVYGVEADWSWTDLKKDIGPNGYYTYTIKSEVNWLASFRSRMGLAVDKTMVYVTGGLALGGVKASTSDNYYDPGNAYGTALNKTKLGWVAGLGVEHMLSPNWSIKGEVLYWDLGRDSATATGTFDGSYTNEWSREIITARVGVNYKW